MRKRALILWALILGGSNSITYATEVNSTIAHEAQFEVYVEKQEFNPFDPSSGLTSSAMLFCSISKHPFSVFQFTFTPKILENSVKGKYVVPSITIIG